MNKNRLFYYITLSAALLLWGCADNNNPAEETPDNSKALLILNEGSREGNNATLARYDLQEETIIKEYFNLVNKDGLGDVANDMVQHGSKIYIAVTNSGTVEVIDAASGISIQQIIMKTA